MGKERNLSIIGQYVTWDYLHDEDDYVDEPVYHKELTGKIIDKTPKGYMVKVLDSSYRGRNVFHVEYNQITRINSAAEKLGEDLGVL